MRSGARWGTAAIAVASLIVGLGPLPAQAQSRAEGLDSGRPRPTNGFSRFGPWNTKLPKRIPLHPQSQTIVDNLKADKDNSFGVWPLMTDTFSAPIYTVGPDAPLTRWKDRWSFEECFNTGDLHP